MAARTNLDMDVLRTFVAGFELGSFARAAQRVGRSQSAVSTQLRKLEEQVGVPLVRKSGRGLALTPAGESFLGYARRLLELNDEAVDRVRGADVEGWVRLGLPQDFAEGGLPAVLGRFSRAHPRVRVEVQVDRSVVLADRTMKGELDIALAWGDGGGGPHARRVAEVPGRWIGRPGWPGVRALGGEPLPFAAFAPPCTFRTAAIEALDAAGLPWRLVFTTPSLAGLWAAAEGGLGITVRSAIRLPPGLAVLDPAAAGLPALPAAALSLVQADAEPPAAAARLADILLETVQAEIGRVAAPG
jgi:DNA-binding transcriptional LysR family regulator